MTLNWNKCGTNRYIAETGSRLWVLYFTGIRWCWHVRDGTKVILRSKNWLPSLQKAKTDANIVYMAIE